jgi:hypothetical protein
VSRDTAKAFYARQIGEPENGYITPADAQAAIDVMYDDLEGPYDASDLTDGCVTPSKLAQDAAAQTLMSGVRAAAVLDGGAPGSQRDALVELLLGGPVCDAGSPSAGSPDHVFDGGVTA